MLSAITIADLILRRLKAKNKACTPLQILKMVYIAYGWGLAVLNRKIFHNRIEAWKYGPMIPDLYYTIRHYGRDPIPLNDIDDSKLPEIDGDIIALVDRVVEVYGNYTGIELSGLTRGPKSPWGLARNEYENVVIPDELIKAHYERKLEYAA